MFYKQNFVLIHSHHHISLGYGDLCPIGSYCPEGSDVPVNCPSGTYQDEEGQSYCKGCPEGKARVTLYLYLLLNWKSLKLACEVKVKSLPSDTIQSLRSPLKESPKGGKHFGKTRNCFNL